MGLTSSINIFIDDVKPRNKQTNIEKQIVKFNTIPAKGINLKTYYIETQMFITILR